MSLMPSTDPVAATAVASSSVLAWSVMPVNAGIILIALALARDNINNWLTPRSSSDADPVSLTVGRVGQV